MEDIRDIAARDPLELGLRHWHSDPQHPGFNYCYTTTTDDHRLRIHIAKKGEFKVLGSFPSFTVANAAMLQLYELERSAPQSRAKQGWYLSPTEGVMRSGWPD